MVDRRAYAKAVVTEGWAWLLAVVWPVSFLVTEPAQIDAEPSASWRTALTVIWVLFLVLACCFLRRADRLARRALRTADRSRRPTSWR